MERTVTLQHPGCIYEGTIMHELIHALGFYHEQSRPDRDSYIRVNYSNIQTGSIIIFAFLNNSIHFDFVIGMEYNFDKYNNSIVNIQNTSYDYGSVMHYGANALSSNGYPTIIPLQANVTIDQRITMSSIDIQEIRMFYNCSTTGSTFPPTTTPRSFISLSFILKISFRLL